MLHLFKQIEHNQIKFAQNGSCLALYCHPLDVRIFLLNINGSTHSHPLASYRGGRYMTKRCYTTHMAPVIVYKTRAVMVTEPFRCGVG